VPEPVEAPDARVLELNLLCAHLQERGESEKAALAHRLHDQLGGLLTAAKMDLSWLQSRVSDPALQQRLAQLGGVLDDAMDLKRRVVEELRPSLLDHFGLPTTLRAHLESVCAAAGLECDVLIPDDICTALPKHTSIALFRIVQAGLENVVCHAQARKVTIELSEGPDRLLLRLIDDGQGFETSKSGQGLAAMRHRIESLGGSFAIGPAPGHGTQLTLTLPRSSPAPAAIATAALAR
jgi:signal transduction histidine kinase